MFRNGRTLITAMCAAALLYAQQETAAQPDSLSSVSAVNDKKTEAGIHSLIAGAGYGNNLVYLGSTISEDQPYGYAALSYGYKNSLYLTLAAIHLAGQDSPAAFYTGTLSFSHTFNSWFDISLSGSRYHVNPSLREILFDNFWYGDATLGIDWRILYTKISAGMLYMDQSSSYYQLKNSRYFATPSFFNKKAYLSFDPWVNLLFGNVSTIETDTNTVVTVTYPFYNPVVSGNGQGAGNGSGQGSGTGSTSGTTTGSTTGSTTTTQTYTTSVLSTKFGLMEIDFGLPVAFNLKNLTIEAEPGYILPMFDQDYYPATKGFVFTLSCYIRFF